MLQIRFPPTLRFRQLIDKLQGTANILTFKCTKSQIAFLSVSPLRHLITYGTIFAENCKYTYPDTDVEFSVYQCELSFAMKESKENHKNYIILTNTHIAAGASHDSGGGDSDGHHRYLTLDFENEAGKKTIESTKVRLLDTWPTYQIKPLPSLADCSFVFTNTQEMKRIFLGQTLVAKESKLILTPDELSIIGKPTSKGIAKNYIFNDVKIVNVDNVEYPFQNDHKKCKRKIKSNEFDANADADSDNDNDSDDNDDDNDDRDDNNNNHHHHLQGNDRNKDTQCNSYLDQLVHSLKLETKKNANHIRMNPKHGEYIEQPILLKPFTFNERPTTNTNIVILGLIGSSEAVGDVDTICAERTVNASTNDQASPNNNVNNNSSEKVKLPGLSGLSGIQIIHYIIQGTGFLTHYLGDLFYSQ